MSDGPGSFPGGGSPRPAGQSGQRRPLPAPGEELGQLNYYEGADDGIMGPQTIQAITYLQRDAGLPQTGQMNAATQAALANFLAHGNNQMNR
jgi:lysozyme family protein